MKNLIDSYIKDHELAWSQTTIKSERARLIQVADFLNKNPDYLWDCLNKRGIKPYSRVTIWTRVCNFWDWGIEHKHFEGSNPYKAWRQINARLFKNAYQRKTPEISLKDAEKRIAQINDSAIKLKAFELLRSGLRFTESLSPDSDVVIGKGGKKRTIYVSQTKYSGGYIKFWRELKKVGLKPHMLRKIKATDLLRKGMDQVTLCEVMGWSSFETARSYLAPLKKEEIKKFFES